LAVALLRVDLARPQKPGPPSKPPGKPGNTRPLGTPPKSSFSLPPTPAVPSFGPVGDCPGKVMNDGIAVVCGRQVTHYPHGLDREPGAL
jgi:hypothetical protein